MSDEEGDLESLRGKVEELQVALDAAKATFTEQLALAEKRREDEVTRMRMEAELKSLREVESLRQQFDIEREQWRKEKEKESDRCSEWKALIQGEKDDLLKIVHDLEARLKHDASKDGGSEPSGAGGNHGGSAETAGESGTTAGGRTVSGGGSVEVSGSTAGDRTAETGGPAPVVPPSTNLQRRLTQWLKP
jgi:hypothetical protein